MATFKLFKHQLLGFEKALWVGEIALSAAAMILIAVSVSIIVFTRFLETPAVDWAPALANVGLIWATWLGVGAATRARVHLVVDLLSGRLTTLRSRRIHAYIVGVITILYGLFIIYYGIPNAVSGLTRHFHALPTLTKFWVFIALPVGSALLIIHTFINLYLDRFQDKDDLDRG